MSGESNPVDHLADAGDVFITTTAYGDMAHFHGACSLLRAHDPVHRVESEKYAPFWVVTRHADVHRIETLADEFTNAPRPVIGTIEADRYREEHGENIRTLIHLDGAEHRVMRGLTADWFRPKNLLRMQADLEALADRAVDQMEGSGGRCDFARDIAMPYPLSVILAILGLPEADYPRIWQLTQDLFGSSDDPRRRNPTPEETAAILADFGAYFTSLTSDRRARPTGDLASTIANATIDDGPLGPLETIGYYIIVATAGHDTTASAIAGGMLALLEHPDQLRRIAADPGLVDTAVEEMIRWTSPVRHFMRNATTRFELGGRSIEAGDAVLLSYPSANRDEAVFERADEFDVGRRPNKHLAFGAGVHFCLGAHLARMEMRTLFRRILPRLRSVELDGEPQLTETLFVGGVKHLPIRYEIAPSS